MCFHTEGEHFLGFPDIVGNKGSAFIGGERLSLRWDSTSSSLFPGPPALPPALSEL